jgi:putative transposase
MNPMGRSRYRIRDEKAPHFVTCTVLNWIPLFTRPQTTAMVLDALKYRQEQADWQIHGYVILENHLHMVVQTKDFWFPSSSLGTQFLQAPACHCA